MGLDASIFALKSKKKFYIDREYNLSWFLQVDGLDTDKNFALYDKARNEKLNQQEMLLLLEEAKKGWERQSRFEGEPVRAEQRVATLETLINIVLLLPKNEEFKVVSDVLDEYYTDYEDFEFVDLC